MKIKGMADLDGSGTLSPIEMEITDPDMIEKISRGMVVGFSVKDRDDSDGAIERALSVLLNGYCAENVSGTPDFILAKYMIDCLKSFNEAVSHRAQWRGESVELPSLQRLNESRKLKANDL
jgi:hypothetical protein